jgi:pyrroloquinoline quinone biosynthesis protein D
VTGDAAGSAVPRFGPGARLRFDATRDAWIILAAERVFLPDEQAVAILKLVDGARTLDDIIGSLAAAFDAPRDLIAADVTAMLRGLADKGVVVL